MLCKHSLFKHTLSPFVIIVHALEYTQIHTHIYITNLFLLKSVCLHACVCAFETLLLLLDTAFSLGTQSFFKKFKNFLNNKTSEKLKSTISVYN